MRTAIAAALVAFLAGCAAPDEGGLQDASGRLTVTSASGQRLAHRTSALTVVPPTEASGAGLPPVSFAETSQLTPPPVVDGQPLQATHVEIAGGFAYVTYGIRGDEVLGAVDVIRIDGDTPSLVQTVTFTDADVSAALVHDGSLYLGTNSADRSLATAAVVERIPLEDGRVPTPPMSVRRSVPGFVVNSLDAAGGRLYATSATDGGLSTLDAQTLEPIAFLPLADARAVGVDDDAISVLQGQPGRLGLYDPQTGALQGQIPVGGLSAPGAKATSMNRGPWNFSATGDGGLVVTRMVAGEYPVEVVGTVAPDAPVPGLAAEDDVTNAASIGLCLGCMRDAACTMRAVYQANGGAGVAILASSHEVTPGTAALPSEARPALVPLGTLLLPGNFSANHVASTDDLLFVAGGVSGVRIVRITRDPAPGEACDAPPDVAGAVPSTPCMWPPDHMLQAVTIDGVTDPDGDAVTLRITGIRQDEPVLGGGSGSTPADGYIDGATAWVRAERAGTSDGRVYHVSFVAIDSRGGTTPGETTLCISHDQGEGCGCVDEGPLYDSTAL